ncbi:MAG TPA: bile acid:sodium symporter family protein [Cellulomonas sp.]
MQASDPDRRPRAVGRAWAAGRSWVDPLVAMVVLALVLGLVAPAGGALGAGLGRATTVAVVLLFFLYGARLGTSQVRAGMRNWRLQGSILGATFVVFPLLGLLVQLVPDAVLAPALRTGVLYLTLLPSTVQSSVVFTSIAGGNVAGAVTGATVSNVAGIVVTPALVAALMGGRGVVGPSGVLAALGELLTPFVVGQCVQRWTGAWLRARPWLTRITDRATIVLVAYAAVSTATRTGAWSGVGVGTIAVLLAVSAALLAVLLSLTWRAGRWWRLDRADRIALLMCGSKKSLATGLPMAAVLLPAATAATVTLPVVVFHQLQLTVCAVVARRLAARAAPRMPG